MGMTIHYRGRLDDTKLVSKLCNEVCDIAKTMGWESQTLDDDWTKLPDASLGEGGTIHGHLGLKGVSISPHPESESLALFFDRDGRLRSPMTMLLILDGSLESEIAWIPIKTQFAGPDTHVWVIGFLKYLKKRYISNLEVSDESQYWDTGDRQELERGMDLINSKIDFISSELSSNRMGGLSDLSADEIALRIEKMFINDNNDNKNNQ